MRVNIYTDLDKCDFTIVEPRGNELTGGEMIYYIWVKDINNYYYFAGGMTGPTWEELYENFPLSQIKIVDNEIHWRHNNRPNLGWIQGWNNSSFKPKLFEALNKIVEDILLI